MMPIILSYLKMMGQGLLLVTFLAGCLWLFNQQRVLIALRTQNTHLITQKIDLETRLLQLKVQTASLSAVLNEQKKQHHHLEERSESTRSKLRQAVVNTPCSRQPVPVDVIRLQYEVLNVSAVSWQPDTSSFAGTLQGASVHHKGLG